MPNSYREIAVFFMCCLLVSGAKATEAEDVFSGAKLDVGRRLIAENACNGSCHQSYTDDNDPISLYTRQNRKVRSAKALVAQVERCVNRLNASIFPEEANDIAAVLNHDYYKFK